MSWEAKDWLQRGGELLATNPNLAQRLIGRSILQMPEEPICYFNLGIGLHQRKRIDAAIRAYKACLKLPSAPLIEAENNLAQDLLLKGDWEEGLKLYEHRFNRRPGNFPNFEKAFGPRHYGKLHKGRPLLLMSEQGLGDTIQFCRFAIELQNQGHEVTLLSQPKLVEFLRESSALKRVESHLDCKTELLKNPLWIPLLSLPLAMGCTRQSIPHSGSYLKVNIDEIRKWKKLMKTKQNHRLVALHWQGNAEHEKSLYSRGRSMQFKDWLSLKDVEGLEFVSVQKGEANKQLEIDSGLPFIEGQNLVSQSFDFIETAAILASCDLLISNDSAVIHLAGAMGVPAWLTLRWIPEWRWGLEGNQTPWYKSLRLFRQLRDGDWEAPVQQIQEELKIAFRN